MSCLLNNGGNTVRFIKRQARVAVRCRTLIFMLLPAILLVLVFNYIPMYGIIIAFKKFNYSLGIAGSPWVGFQNFELFFRNDTWLEVTRNTMLYNIGFLIVNTLLQLIFAMILSELTSRWFKKISQTLMLLPYFISWVVVGAIAFNLLSYERGFVNSFLTMFGMGRMDFYNTPGYWPLILVLFHIWKGVGYSTVVYLAAITGMDYEILEAAEIDGANIFQRLRHITFPSILPTIIILLLLNVGSLFRGDFGMFWNLVGQSGRLTSTTEIIDTYVFKSLQQSGGMERGAAAGLYQSLMCFITILLANFLVRKYDKDYALF